MNPYLLYWFVTSLSGRISKLEGNKDLRLRQVVSGAFQGKNRVGWRNLTKGRTAKGMVRLQEW